MKGGRALEAGTFWLFIGGALVLLFLLLVAPQYRNLRALSRDLAAARAQSSQLVRHIRRTRVEAVAIRNNPYFVERTARAELGLRRPGEREMVLRARVPSPPFTLQPRPPAGTLERLLAPFADDPLFRAATLLWAVSMLLVALMSAVRPALPALRATQAGLLDQG